MHASILGWWFHQERVGPGIVARVVPARAFGTCQESGVSFWLGGLLCIVGPILVLSVWSKDVKLPIWVFWLRGTSSLGGDCREPRPEGPSSSHLI